MQDSRYSADCLPRRGSIGLALTQVSQVVISVTVNRVIVNKSHGLHEGIDDRRADEIESALLEVLAYLLR